MATPARQSKNWLPIGVTGFLIIWFGWYFVHPIDLLPADLGRHITNGSILLTQPQNIWNVLHTNFYSYATPSAPFVNHHWLVGIFYFCIWKLSGFVGLGIFHLLLNLTTFILFFRLAVRHSSFKIASLVALCTIPLLAERAEIRPETFSYLFSALYLTILSGVVENRLRRGWLLAIVPLQIIWVNTHIYFFLGFGYVGAYWLATLTRKSASTTLFRPFSTLLLGIIFASLLNPNGWHGLTYPAQIFNNYAFVVGENQSVLQFISAGLAYANVYVFIVFSIVLVASLWYSHSKKNRAIGIAELCIIVFLTCWSYSAIRNVALFGYVNIVVLSVLIYKNWYFGKTDEKILPGKKFTWCAVVLFFISVLINSDRIKTLLPYTNFGLVPRSTAVATFITTNNIAGPMFNDFDVGGYAIFYLYPRLAPFVDNRPEAYPAAFMTDAYVPMQTSDAVWQTQLQKYNFNTILYSFEDHAPWATSFIVKRLVDPEWAPVYADNFAIVFLRRNTQNAGLIKQYEMDKSRFGLTTEK